MFEKARIKLTLWYVLIIMSISCAFSVSIYRVISDELERVVVNERTRIERFLYALPPKNEDDTFGIYDANELAVLETRSRLSGTLILINAIILGFSTIAGYFLAGQTLQPIQQMMESQNRFITDASHELKTPLTALKTEIEVNLRDKTMTLNESKKLLESNLKEVNNLQMLFENLLLLTHHEQKSQNSSLTKLHLDHSIVEAVKKMRPIAKKKGIELSIRKNVKNPIIEGNHSSIRELCIILLDNAIKYSPKHTNVTVEISEIRNEYVINVIDQGIGIHSKDIPFLFDRFYRADLSRTKNYIAGYGLGLSIAKKIVETHKGTISVCSKLHKGSTFSITFPHGIS